MAQFDSAQGSRRMTANNNPAAIPDWLEKSNRIEPLTAPDRVALTPAPAASIPLGDVKPAGRLTEKLPAAAPTAGQTEICRAGFAPIALLPSTVLLGLVTAAWLTFIHPRMPTAYLTEYVTLPLAALWTGQFVRAGYRLLAYRCRLTSTQFARSRGPLYPR